MPNTMLNRSGVLLLTNKSGGAVAQGDVVVESTGTANAFTTTTTAGFITGTVYVVVEPNGIANDAIGLVAFYGYVPKVNLSGAASLGDLFATHTVAKQAARHGAPSIAGDFGQVLATGTSPAAILWGSPKTSGATVVNTTATLLDYWLASDVSNLTLTKVTWVDLFANQNFTVGSASSRIHATVRGHAAVGLAAPSGVGVQLIIDSAGSPVTKLMCGETIQNATGINLFAGSGTADLGSLSAGVHTAKLQAY